jgi:hypothetical protein
MDIFKISIVTDSLQPSFIKPSVIIGCNWWVIISIFVVALLLLIFFKFIHRRLLPNHQIIPIELSIGKQYGVKYKIERNEETIQIAHRIYIELVTRKAALEVDPEHDVIEEVYNSWYDLFKSLRSEIKSIPGSFLLSSPSTRKLSSLTIEILNIGLRPHLTTYQADFKQWYKSELTKQIQNQSSPQVIQKQYPHYNALVADMAVVNSTMKEYARELAKFFEPKKAVKEDFI